MPRRGLLVLLLVSAPALAQEGPDVAPAAPEAQAGPLGDRFVWERRAGLGRRVAGVAVQPIPAGAWVAVDEEGGVWLSEDEGVAWDNVVRPVGGLEEDELPDEEELLLEAESRRDEALDDGGGLEAEDLVAPDADATELPEAPEVDEGAIEEASTLAADLATESADERRRALPLAWVDPLDPERVYVGRSDGLWLSTSGGRTWDHVHVADEGDPAVTAFAHAPDGALLLGTTDGVRYSTDGGATWIDVVDATDGARVASVVVDEGTIWAATDAGLFRSANGLAWDPVVLPGSEPVRAVVPDPNWDRGFWVATTAALYRTDDGGATFYVSGRQPLRNLRALVHLDEPGHLLATSDNGVWESMDGGVAWLTADRRLSEPDVRALALSESGPVIATPTGIWRMVAPRAAPRAARRVQGLALADTIEAATHRDAMDMDLLSLAKIGLAAPLVPSLELRFDWGRAARRVADYTRAQTNDDFGNDWNATATLCWGGCTGATSYGSSAYDLDEPDIRDGGFTVVDGKVYDEGEPVAAAANVAQNIRSYRSYLADHVADAWLARVQLLNESAAAKELPLRDQVFQAIQLQELEARLDALTDGAFTRSALSPASEESR